MVRLPRAASPPSMLAWWFSFVTICAPWMLPMCEIGLAAARVACTWFVTLVVFALLEVRDYVRWDPRVEAESAEVAKQVVPIIVLPSAAGKDFVLDNLPGTPVFTFDWAAYARGVEQGKQHAPSGNGSNHHQEESKTVEIESTEVGFAALAASGFRNDEDGVLGALHGVFSVTNCGTVFYDQLMQLHHLEDLLKALDAFVEKHCGKNGNVLVVGLDLGGLLAATFRKRCVGKRHVEALLVGVPMLGSISLGVAHGEPGIDHYWVPGDTVASKGVIAGVVQHNLASICEEEGEGADLTIHGLANWVARGAASIPWVGLGLYGATPIGDVIVHAARRLRNVKVPVVEKAKKMSAVQKIKSALTSS
jgi:hypothetical protein